jgi:prepilin-type N-terminal cleavage/methylation domain-containing protein
MKKQRQSGFTLIELTLVMGISVMVAGALVGMLQAHIQMLTQASKFNFLAQDAPTIGLLLTRTIGNAEDYRIYADGPTARADGTRALTGSAVRLWMRQPNSTSNVTSRQAVVSYEAISGHSGIYFFLANSVTGTFSATPNWELAGGKLTGVTFDATSGVLLATLNGSYNDWYKFAAEKK